MPLENDQIATRLIALTEAVNVEAENVSGYASSLAKTALAGGVDIYSLGRIRGSAGRLAELTKTIDDLIARAQGRVL